MFTSLFLNDQTLIHEINHAVTGCILEATEKGNISKNGLSIADLTTNINVSDALEEIINDRSAQEIHEIFYGMGGKISGDNIVSTSTVYTKLFPLIENFYQKYKELLKKARIGENKDILFNQIDKDKYIEFEKLINSALNDAMYHDYLSDSYIKKAEDLLNQMDTNNKKNENNNDYIKELESLGNVVKLLNYNVNNNNYYEEEMVDNISKTR